MERQPSPFSTEPSNPVSSDHAQDLCCLFGASNAGENRWSASLPTRPRIREDTPAHGQDVEVERRCSDDDSMGDGDSHGADGEDAIQDDDDNGGNDYGTSRDDSEDDREDDNGYNSG